MTKPTQGRVVMTRTSLGTWPGIVVMVKGDLIVWVVIFSLNGSHESQELTRVSEHGQAIGWYWPPRETES